MVKSVLTTLILLATIVATKAQPAVICNWDSDKQGAVVLTFDDWSPGHYPIAVPELKKRDMVGTFFPMISSIVEGNHSWPCIIETVSYGNEMGNHSMSHPQLTEASAEELSSEIRGAKDTIDKNLTTQTVISFDYPFGAYNNQVIDSVRGSGHICGRGVNSPSNYTYNFATSDKDYFVLKSYALSETTTTADYKDEVDKVVNGGGLLVFMYHSVDDEVGCYNDNWYAKVVEDSLDKQLDLLKSYEDKVWITTLAQAVKYHREANSATLSEVTPFDGKKWVLNLSDTLSDNDLYNQPLSLKVKMNGAGFNKVSQNNTKLDIDSIYNDTILFKAVPDAGNITLNIAVRDTIYANNNLIEYTGRIDFSDPLAPAFSYSGVSIRANFYGTSIHAILNDDMNDNYYNVILDGQVISILKVTKGKKEYVLAEGLEDKLHEIELFKRTELTFGKTQFYGFTLDEEKTLATISDKRELLIEYIGNSITCGYGNEGTNAGNFVPETENHYMTYAAITSRNFNARHMAVSRSGIGIYRNYDGPAEGNADCMTNLYANTFLYDNTIKYDFAEQPDVVCINLGTNDFSTSGADSALYVENYFRLIDTIQAKYNMPEIVCLLGSMMSGNSLIEVRSYLNFVADSANKKGKGMVSFFEMSPQTGDLGIGVHYHPTVAQHMKNALELTNYLKTLKGWEVKPMPVAVKTTNAQEIQITFNVDLIHESEDYSGFSFTGASNLYTIDKVEADAYENILNFSIKENIEPNANIYFNYQPGTIASTDTIKLDTINNFVVENNLMPTFISAAAVDGGGTSITFETNKNLSSKSTIEGLSISTSQGKLTIQSFEIRGKFLIVHFSEPIAGTEEIFAKYKGTGILGVDKVILEEFKNMAIDNSGNTSFYESEIEKNYRLWPNPNSTGLFYYESYNNFNADYFLYNHVGTTINGGQLVEGNGVFRIGDNIPGGVYYLKISMNNQIETHKLLITN